MLAGIFGACLPDLDKPGQVFFGRSPFPRWFDAAHARIQDEEVHRFTMELASAAVFSVALVALLPRRPRGAMSFPARRGQHQSEAPALKERPAMQKITPVPVVRHRGRGGRRVLRLAVR